MSGLQPGWHSEPAEYKDEKALDCKDAVSELKNTLAELAQTKFDHITAQYEEKTQDIDHVVNLINSQIEKAELSDKIIGESFYNALIDKEKERLESLAAEYNEKLSVFRQAVADGTIDKGSEAWQKMKSDIDSVAESIQDAETKLLEYGKSLKDIAKIKFDDLKKQFDNAGGMLSGEAGLIEKQMEIDKASGMEPDESYYSALIELASEEMSVWEKEAQRLRDSLQEALDSGKVEKYSDKWYEMADAIRDADGKVLDARLSVIKYEDSLKELASLKFDSIDTQYGNILDLIDMGMQQVEEQINTAEASGYIAGTSFYNELINRNDQKISVLKKMEEELIKLLEEALASGDIKEYDENWFAMAKRINEVRLEIQKAQTATAEFEKSIKDVAKQKFDSLKGQFSGAVGIITSAIGQMEKKISLVEETGHMTGESFYEALIEAEKTHVEALAKEYKTLSSSMGGVEMYSEDWYDMKEAIAGVGDELLEAETALIKYSNALRQLEWDVFDRMQESISGLAEESDFIMDLMQKNRELFNENGTMNDRGNAVQGLHVINYDIYMKQAQEYKKALLDVNKELADDPGNMKLQDRYKELLKLQREAVLNAEDEKTALKDLLSDGYDKLLSYLDKLIDARKKALNAEKDLHDYEKTIADQTAEVEKYQKLLQAYGGDDSEEMKAVIQKTKDSLIKAQEELSETEYDRYMADQEAMLDNFRDELEAWINARLDNIDGLLQQAVDSTNMNAEAIRTQINSDLTSVGMNLTENFNKVFEIDPSGGVKDIVSGFFGDSGDFAGGITAVDNAIGAVKAESELVKMSVAEADRHITDKFPELQSALGAEGELNKSLGVTNSAISQTNSAIDAVNLKVQEYGGSMNTGFDNVVKAVEGVGDKFTSYNKNIQDALDRAQEAVDNIHNTIAELEPPETPDYTADVTPDDSGDDNGWDDGGWEDNTPAPPAVPDTTVRVEVKPKDNQKPADTDKEKKPSYAPDVRIEVYNSKNQNLAKLAKGAHRLGKDMTAITQEEGPEAIYSPYYGGMLTPLHKGDTIFTAEQTDRLYELSKMDPEKLRKLFFGGGQPELKVQNAVPDSRNLVKNTVANKNDVQISLVLPNARNDAELADSLQHNGKFIRMIRDAVSGAMTGNPYKYLRTRF